MDIKIIGINVAAVICLLLLEGVVYADTVGVRADSSYDVTVPEQKSTGDKPSAAESVRFLMQTTLGFTKAELAHLQEIGYERWIEKQLVVKATRLEPYIEYLHSRSDIDRPVSRSRLSYHKVMVEPTVVGYFNSSTAWLRAVLSGDDLLRQRVAWALSQIFVVGNRTNVLTEASTNYYDMLLGSAFVDFENLLLNVSAHPVMGRYLSYLGNSKEDRSKNRYPDENYAREVMQLFHNRIVEVEQ